MFNKAKAGFLVLPMVWAATYAHAADGGVREVVRSVQKVVAQATGAVASGATVAQFRYRSNDIYHIKLKQGMFATINIPKNEPILQFAVSNPGAVDLSVNQEANAGMLRLMNAETVSATVVTAKRVYYLMIHPAAEGESWHVGVSWTFDEEGSGGTFGYRAAHEGAQSARGAIEPSFDPYDGIKGHPNFSYSYDLNNPLAPAAVWDNGRFTWIQLRPEQQSVPAVFLIGPNGPEVVNYTLLPGGKQILVNRLMPRFVLRLGSEAVEINAKRGG